MRATQHPRRMFTVGQTNNCCAAFAWQSGCRGWARASSTAWRNIRPYHITHNRTCSILSCVHLPCVPKRTGIHPGFFLGGGQSPPKIFGQNYIFFTIYCILFTVAFSFYSMQCAHVTEWRHEVRRVLVDFTAKNYLLHPFTECCWNITLGSLWANSTAIIKYETFQTTSVWFFFKCFISRDSRLSRLM